MSGINPIIMKSMAENKNMITTAEVLSLGFSKQLLLKYVRAGLLERIRQGVYILPDSIHDDMYTMMLRSEYIVFSHESALFLNGLSDRTPFMHSITLPSDKTVPGSIKDECTYFYIKPELHRLGLIERETGLATSFAVMIRNEQSAIFCERETAVMKRRSFPLSKTMRHTKKKT